MRTLRKVIFWLHLICGLGTGLVLLVLCLSGLAIVFEHEILEAMDREQVELRAGEGEVRKPLEVLVSGLRERRPEFVTSQILIPSDPDTALTFLAGRGRSLYVNPYSGEATAPRSSRANEIFHGLIYLHRWLSFSDKPAWFGRLVTGSANLVLVFLCLSGLWLWFPKGLARRFLRPVLWFVPRYQGRARDLNWHNVAGFWSLPVVLILAVTAVVISFGWAHSLLFQISGEKAPVHRDGRMLATPAPSLPTPPSEGATVLSLDEHYALLLKAYPKAEMIALPVPPVQSAPRLVEAVVFEPALFQTKGRIQLRLDPWSGTVLSKVGWEDRSPGLRARIWVRFLHTGEAFGLAGKIVASLATFAVLVLVYTGFALSYRRFARTK